MYASHTASCSYAGMQLTLKLPNWKDVKLFKHPSFVLFMEAYYVPYTPKDRYWTGLLLLARAIIYLISAANVSGDPQIQLVSIIFILSCIILLIMFIATKIFKKWLIDLLESFFYFNVIFLASFTSYRKQPGRHCLHFSCTLNCSDNVHRPTPLLCIILLL